MRKPNTRVHEIQGKRAIIVIDDMYTVIIDIDDIEKIIQYNWYADRSKIKSHKLFYFKTYLGKGKYITMHRYIMGLLEYDNIHVIDHINHITLDNRKQNLRLVTISENIQNSRVSQRNKVDCKGVSYDKQHKKWSAYRKIDGKMRKKLFSDLEDAKQYAIELYKL